MEQSGSSLSNIIFKVKIDKYMTIWGLCKCFNASFLNHNTSYYFSYYAVLFWWCNVECTTLNDFKTKIKLQLEKKTLNRM